MAEDKFRYQLQVNGSFVKAYNKLVGAKIVVAYNARRHKLFNYQAVDSTTGETWGWDCERSRLKRLDLAR